MSRLRRFWGVSLYWAGEVVAFAAGAALLIGLAALLTAIGLVAVATATTSCLREEVVYLWGKLRRCSDTARR